MPIDVRSIGARIDVNGDVGLYVRDPEGRAVMLEELALDGLIWRVSEASYAEYSALVELLSARYTLVNNWDCVSRCSDKWRTYVALASAGIPLIPTELLTPGVPVPAFPGQPSVIKPCIGARGLGVRTAEPGSDPQIVEAHLAQPLIAGSAAEHVRVLVCGFEPVAAMHRTPPVTGHDGLQVNNLAAGGKPTPADLEPVRHVAADAARCLGGDLVAVDLVPWQGGLAVLEVNSSPGLQGIAAVAQVDCVTAAARAALTRIEQGK